MNEVAQPWIARRRALARPALWGWALYDLANTMFSALFVSVNFPIFVREFVRGTDRVVGLTNSLACLAAAAVVPILGTISDQTRRRLPILLALTILCCAATPVVAFLPLQWALLGGGLAIFAYQAGLALYDAILPDLAEPEDQGLASGLGVGIGYGGTIIALACAALIQRRYGEGTLASIRVTNLMIGTLFFVFALPLFILHREAGPAVRLHPVEAAVAGLGRVVEGARAASPKLWLFIAASFLFANAAMAVIVFFGIFARQVIQMEMGRFYLVYAQMAVAALVGALAIGLLVDRYGPRRLLFAVGFLWIAIFTSMMFVRTEGGFHVVGLVGGVALGGLWTASRPMLARLADPERMGESFGFQGIASRTSAVVGPAVYGILSTRYDDYRAGLAALIVFYVVGLGILIFVPPGGRQ